MTTQLKLNEEQWNQVAAQLPGILGVRARRDVNRYRTFIDEVLWVVGNDLVWHELQPETCGWRSVYMRFQRWSESGVWEIVGRAIEDNPTLREALNQRLDEQQRSRERRLRRAPSAPLPVASVGAGQISAPPPDACIADGPRPSSSASTDVAFRKVTAGPALTLKGTVAFPRRAGWGSSRRGA